MIMTGAAAPVGILQKVVEQSGFKSDCFYTQQGTPPVLIWGYAYAKVLVPHQSNLREAHFKACDKRTVSSDELRVLYSNLEFVFKTTAHTKNSLLAFSLYFIYYFLSLYFLNNVWWTAVFNLGFCCILRCFKGFEAIFINSFRLDVKSTTGNFTCQGWICGMTSGCVSSLLF